jgi:hypothetical protein
MPSECARSDTYDDAPNPEAEHHDYGDAGCHKDYMNQLNSLIKHLHLGHHNSTSFRAPAKKAYILVSLVIIIINPMTAIHVLGKNIAPNAMISPNHVEAWVSWLITKSRNISFSLVKEMGIAEAIPTLVKQQLVRDRLR